MQKDADKRDNRKKNKKGTLEKTINTKLFNNILLIKL